MSIKFKLRKFFATFTALACMLPVFALTNDVAADGTVDLVNQISSFSVVVKDINTSEIINSLKYNDKFQTEISWEYKPERESVQVGGTYTYKLPDEITYTDFSGDIMNGSAVIGRYRVENNIVYLTYSDNAATYCGQDERVGTLKLEGTITDDGNGGNAPKDMTILFQGVGNQVEIPLSVGPTPNFRVTKASTVISDSDHTYNWIATVTATGNHTHVVFQDTMWPGMTLIGTPKIYTDAACTQAYTGSTEDWTFEGNKFYTEIASMGHNETLYVSYNVQIDDALYAWDTADEFVSLPGNAWGYEDGYQGVVHNCAAAKSDQVPNFVQGWETIGTINTYLDKGRNAAANNPEKGILSWNLMVSQITDSAITSGFILDYLPEYTEFLPDSVTVYYLDNGSIHDFIVSDYVSITTSVDSDDNSIVKFEFTNEMINELRNREVRIQYKIKVTEHEQTGATETYLNTAEIYYNTSPDPLRTCECTMDYTRPSDVEKTVEYNGTTAPYAYFKVVVNSLEYDLDPNSDTFILSDTMGEVFDLDMASVRIDGVAPSNDAFSYDATTRTFQLELNDETTYVITYRARVNLMPGSSFADLGTNDCSILGVPNFGNGGSIKLGATVQSSSANSSSIIKPSLYVIKHETGSFEATLSGAKFSLTACDYEGGTVTAGSVVATLITSSDGTAEFASLNQGTIYMVTELTAPEGYELDETPRFVVFSNGDTYPSTITFDGETYDLIVLDSTKASYDMYWADSLEDSDDPTDPSDDPTDPSDDPTDPSDDPTDPSDDPTDPSDDPTDPSDDPTDPSDDPADPTTPDQPVVPVQPVKPVTPPANPTGVQSADVTQTPADSTTTTPAPTTSTAVQTGEDSSELVFFAMIFLCLSFVFLTKAGLYTKEND